MSRDGRSHNRHERAAEGTEPLCTRSSRHEFPGRCVESDDDSVCPNGVITSAKTTPLAAIGLRSPR